LSCISFHNRAEGTAGAFQRGKFPNLIFYPETRFSIAQPQALPKSQQNSQHTASLDVLAEPNYYSKCVQTSSTRVFASHHRQAGSQSQASPNFRIRSLGTRRHPVRSRFSGGARDHASATTCPNAIFRFARNAC
jgi:hypothetical protein